MKALGAAGITSKFQSAAPCVSPSGAGGVQRGWGGGQRVGWERGEAAVALKTTGDLKRQPPLLGAVVRLLNLRGLAEQQERQSDQLPPAPNTQAHGSMICQRRAASPVRAGADDVEGGVAAGGHGARSARADLQGQGRQVGHGQIPIHLSAQPQLQASVYPSYCLQLLISAHDARPRAANRKECSARHALRTV